MDVRPIPGLRRVLSRAAPRFLTVVAGLSAIGCGRAPAGQCGDLPAGAEFVERTATGQAVTGHCTDVVRVESNLFEPSFAEANAGSLPPVVPTYSYVVRARDRLVMLDAGWGLWVVGIDGGVPVLEPNGDALERLTAAVGALAPGAGLEAIDAVVLEHAHPDHTGQIALVAAATGRPVDVWVGAEDAAMLSDRAALAACTGQLPSGAEEYVPLFGPDVATIHAVGPQSEVVPGVVMIPAPSHTLGSRILWLSDLGVTVTGNHLDPSDAGTTGDCGTPDEASGCPAACTEYAESLNRFPPDTVPWFVHP